MDKYVTELGVGGIFAVMVIKIVLDFLKTKKSAPSESYSKESSRMRIAETAIAVNDIKETVDDKKWHFFSMKECIEDIHGIVCQTDSLRVPLIYNPALNTAIVKLSENIKLQTAAIEKLAGEG